MHLYLAQRLAHRVATIKTSITLPPTLLNQAKVLSKYLNISQNHLFQIAIEQFIESYQDELLLDEMTKFTLSEPSSVSDQAVKTTTQSSERQLVINQGAIYWLQMEALSESPEIRHPYVVMQENIFNHSRIHTVIVCALTSNLKRASLPGNVLLEANEANLPKQSVVEISKVSSIDKAQLGEYIGSLSEQRVKQILAGMRFLHLSFFT
jgi:mRNA interferase MazF